MKSTRTGTVLLPGEDAAAFNRMRNALFDQYQPATEDEAWQVDSIAANQWEIARCRRWQVEFRARAAALLNSSPEDKTAQAEAKRWLRTLRESERMESMLERMTAADRKHILWMQKQRRLGYIAGTPEGVAAELAREPSRAPAPLVDPWAATHPALHENGDPEKRKARDAWTRLQQRLSPERGNA